MTLAEKDLAYVWHPYTHQKLRSAPIPIVRGEGALLFDDQGSSYIDGISSWWVNIHGHAHPYIANKLFEQASKLEHVIFTGFTHEPAVLLAEQLVALIPGVSKIFYSDNGSTATEVAIKMALQYWLNKGINRKKVIALNNSYHGDTFGAMSISNRGLFNTAFDDKLFDVTFIDVPAKDNISKLISIINSMDDAACFIYEPLLQGAGGMVMYEQEPLRILLEAIRSRGILCIADEVLTGFYRTGSFFASQQLNIDPDIICLSKGLTGGTMALGVTGCSKNIYDAFISDDKMKTFYHGHSFTANPLACTAALASLDLFKQEGCITNIRNLCKKQMEFIEKLKPLQTEYNIKHLRVCGTICAFEVITDSSDSYLNSLMGQFTEFCMEEGVYLRPLGNTIYIMPPYCITEEQLKTVYSTVTKYLINLKSNLV